MDGWMKMGQLRRDEIERRTILHTDAAHQFSSRRQIRIEFSLSIQSRPLLRGHGIHKIVIVSVLSLRIVEQMAETGQP